MMSVSGVCIGLAFTSALLAGATPAAAQAAVSQPGFADTSTRPAAQNAVERAEPLSYAVDGAYWAGNRLTVPAPDVASLIEEDARGYGDRRGRRGRGASSARHPQRRLLDLLADGGWLWTHAFRSSGAEAIRLRLGSWSPPNGVRLFVHDAADRAEHRELPSATGPSSGTLWTPAIHAAEVNLEIFVPAGIDPVDGPFEFAVDALAYNYRPIVKGDPPDPGERSPATSTPRVTRRGTSRRTPSRSTT